MIDDRNPVVRLYLSDWEAPYPLSEPITEQDVVELDAALQDGEPCEGWSLVGMVLLATRNLRLACTLSMPKNAVVRCAQTLLELYVAEDSPHSALVSVLIPATYMLDSTEFGALLCEVCMQIAEAFSKDEDYAQAYECCTRAVRLAEEAKGLSEQKRLVLAARAVAKEGEIRVRVGDAYSGIRTLGRALDYLEVDAEARSLRDVALARANILRELAGALQKNGDLDGAIGRQQNAVGILKELHGHGKELDGELPETLAQLGMMLHEAGRLTEARASLEEACDRFQTLELSDSVPVRLKVVDLLGEIAGVLADDGQRAQADDTLERVLSDL